MSPNTRTERRKLDHIKICLERGVQFKTVTAGFEDVHLIHRALPEVNLREVDTTSKLLGHPLTAPIIIEAMTGGTPEAEKLNATLAEAAEKFSIGMGVGSQRAALENPHLTQTYAIVRDKAPNAFIMANLGCSQLLKGNCLEQAEKAVEMIKADALAVHLNPLQEAVMVEGQTDFKGSLGVIKEIAQTLKSPVVAKETGAGVAAEEARLLEGAGVKAIDVGGAGGTSWSAVEYYRARSSGNERGEQLGSTFWDWGIPTVPSLIEVRSSTNLTVIASGGIRSGIEAAKALALGADAVGIALPLLKAAVRGRKQTFKAIQRIVEELKVAMFLAGAASVKELTEKPVVITGKTAEWLKARGFSVESSRRIGR
ncbi:MAG: type 2 isopentenyl-diphosphate Delta-isomerase [Candidatus Bathyarchaeia archaeon]